MLASHFTLEQLEGIHAFLRMGTHINQELAAGLKEHTQPNAQLHQRLEQARQFRRATDALAPRLEAELGRLASVRPGSDA